MSVWYRITPYEPFPESPEHLAELRRLTDLQIDPADYERHILERWPLTTQWDSGQKFLFCGFLNWCSSDGIRWPGIELMLHQDCQTVAFQAPSIEFIFWHRAYIPAKNRLYLSDDTHEGWKEILPGLTIEEMSAQLGIRIVTAPKMIFLIAPQDDWLGYRLLRERSSAQCAGAQQVRRLANALYRGQHGLRLVWLEVERITSPIEAVELPDISSPGETFPRILGPVDTRAIMRAPSYEPGRDGLFPWPEDIDEV